MKVPTGIDLVAHVAAFDPSERRGIARVRVRRGAATGLRRMSRLVERGEDADLLDVWYVDPEWVADRIARYGPAAVVLDPPEVRDAVLRRFRALAGDPAGSRG